MGRLSKDSVEYRLIEITDGLLQENYGEALLEKSSGERYAYFEWTAEFKEEIVSSYQKEHGPISINDMRIIRASLEATKWRTKRLLKARINLGGNIPSMNQNYAVSKSSKNAEDRKGILMVTGLSAEDTGLLIEYLEAIQQRRKEHKELPPHLQRYVMKGKSLKKILEVVGDEYDAIQELAKDGVGVDSGISAEKLQMLSVDELKGRVNEVMKKQSVKKGKKKGKKKRLVKQTTKEEASNLRLYGLLSSKELMVGVAKTLQRGEAIMWPVTITSKDGNVVSFLTVATMVRQDNDTFLYLFLAEFLLSSSKIGFLYSSLFRELSMRKLGTLNSRNYCALDRVLITTAVRLTTSTPSFLRVLP
jgi:hypothetical protein